MSEQRVRRVYGRLAPVYDQLWHTYLTRTLSFLDQWTQLSSNARVLDVGCGTGLFAYRLLQHAPQQMVAGIDVSRPMLTVAQRRCAPFPHVAFQAASMTALPFVEQRFDAVVSASALHYVDNPHAALLEMKRVVHSDGSVTIMDWCRDYLACQILDAVLAWVDPAHHRTYTLAELHHALTEAGFTVTRTRRKRFGVFWGMMIATARPQST